MSRCLCVFSFFRPNLLTSTQMCATNPARLPHDEYSRSEVLGPQTLYAVDLCSGWRVHDQFHLAAHFHCSFGNVHLDVFAGYWHTVTSCGPQNCASRVVHFGRLFHLPSGGRAAQSPSSGKISRRVRGHSPCPPCGLLEFPRVERPLLFC